MIIELGHFALIIAFVTSLCVAVLPLAGLRFGMVSLAALAVPATLVMAAATTFSFAALVAAFIASDFSVALVAAHSHSTKPLIYKISGTWGNHEGSLLLWILILVLFGGLLALRGREIDFGLKIRTLAVQAMVTAGFLAFCLFTSNPFARLETAPLNGRGLNPILQDPGLALHPPTLYVGYVGLSLAFAFAVAGLIEGRIDRDWARHVRPWVSAAWCALTGRNRAWQLVGLLRAWLGRLVVLGSGRERLAHAVARGDGASAFDHRRRTARQAEKLDRAAGHPRLLAVACRHLHRPLGASDIGSQLCQRSGARRLHPRHPSCRRRRAFAAVRHSRTAACQP